MKNTRFIKNTILVCTTMATLGFIACETTEQIDDFPIIKPQIVLNCFISPDSAWEFQISKSLSVLDNAQTGFLTNANVSVYENGNKLFSPYEINPNEYFIYKGNKPRIGHTYKITVDVKKYPSVSASCTVPKRVKIQQIKGSIRDSNTYYDPWMKQSYGELKGDLTISFTDPPDEDNFYFISIYAIDTFKYFQPPYDTMYNIYYNYFSNESDANPVVEISSGKYFIFSDVLFNGQDFDFFIKFRDWSFRSNKSYIVALFSVDKNMYLYYRSKALFNQREDNPFAEPVQVYSNVENGFGVFGAYEVDVKSFKF